MVLAQPVGRQVGFGIFVDQPRPLGGHEEFEELSAIRLDLERPRLPFGIDDQLADPVDDVIGQAGGGRNVFGHTALLPKREHTARPTGEGVLVIHRELYAAGLRNPTPRLRGR